MDQNLGQNIAALRHKRRLTQEQLAELSDTTVNYLSKIERGVISNISAKLLAKFANALNVSMDDLYYNKITAYADDEQPVELKLLNTALLKLPSDEQIEYAKHFIALLKLNSSKN